MTIHPQFRNILVTGGAGFVGSHLALRLKEEYPERAIVALDNLQRWGSQLNLRRLTQGGVEFRHCDIRCAEDLASVATVDLVIDCAAEPSVHAGSNGSPQALINGNLNGTVHTLELARQRQAACVFLSTSRVYPIAMLNNLPFDELETRYQWRVEDEPAIPGLSPAGIGEEFPLAGARSFYGATKLASELLIAEYHDTYGVPSVINRCGVITGPWQMGKVDQGVFMMWIAHHRLGRPLNYHGFGGSGKQVRDLLHVEDLFQFLCQQLAEPSSLDGSTWQIGGGLANSVSLLELTKICQQVSGKSMGIGSRPDTNRLDLRIYVSDCAAARQRFGWQPARTVPEIVEEIDRWVADNQQLVEAILG